MAIYPALGLDRVSNLKCYQFELYIQTHKNSISDQSWQCLKPSRLNFKALLEYLPRPVIFAKGDNGIGHCPTFIKFFSYHMYWFNVSGKRARPFSLENEKLKPLQVDCQNITMLFDSYIYTCTCIYRI